MTVTVDLDGFLIDGTDYVVEAEGIEGLWGLPPVRTPGDLARGHADGTVFGYDYLEHRIITIPVVIRADTPADCITLIRALEAAWAPAEGLDDDRTLTIDAWGETSVFTGRPRGCEVVATDLPDGAADALLIFHVAGEVGSS